MNANANEETTPWEGLTPGEGEIVFVYGHVCGPTRKAMLKDGSTLWIGTVDPEGTGDDVELRAMGHAADYLAARDPMDGDRVFAAGRIRRARDGSWYVAVEAAATDPSDDWEEGDR